MNAPTTVAAFDFDQTLTRGDTVVPFMRLLTPRRRLAAGVARHGVGLLAALARRDRNRLRSIATEVVFRGRPIDEVERSAQGFGASILAGLLRDDTVGRLGWHRAQGHLVVIVSASYEHYVHVVGDELGVDGVVATRLEVADRHCTGRLDGDNCRGTEKVRRLEAWMVERGIERDRATVWAYGDSAGDRELLAWADHPVWVTEPLTSVAP